MPSFLKGRIKLISILIAGVFLTQDLASAASIFAPVDKAFSSGAAPAIPDIVRDPALLDIPFEHATGREFYAGDNGRMIILLEDAHANYSGQLSQAKALDYLMRRYGISLVLAEGSAEDSTLTDFKDIADSRTWDISAKRFLMEGVFKAAEYLNLTSDHPMHIRGVEYEDLYNRSLETYAKLVEQREETLRYLHGIRSAIGRIKNRLYPKNILSYEEGLKSQDTQNGDWMKHFQSLLALAEQARLDGSGYPEIVKLKSLNARESLIDFERVNAERLAVAAHFQDPENSEDKEMKEALKKSGNSHVTQSAFINRLLERAGRSGVDLRMYPTLIEYRDYLAEFLNLEVSRLLAEMDGMEDEAYKNLLSGEDAKKIRALDRFVSLLQKAYEVKLSSDDFETLAANDAQFKTVAWEAFLNQKLAELGYFEDMVRYRPYLEDAKSAVEAFYRLVRLRDRAFVDNARRIMGQTSERAAFLIVGGYHTAHLTRLLRQEGTSFAVLTPSVTDETDHDKYERLLLSSLKPADGLSRPTGKIEESSDAPPSQKDTLQIAYSRSGKGVELLRNFQKERRTKGLPVPAILPGFIEALSRKTSESPNGNAPFGLAEPDQEYPLVLAARMASRPADPPGETYDDIVLKELAKHRGITVDDLEGDFERSVAMLEERIENDGFIDPAADPIAAQIHRIYDRLTAPYRTRTSDPPGKLHVVDANTVNAFVIRKRTDVYFFKGLYEALYDISKKMNVPLTEDMIAFILAHEMSHALQHSSHQGLDVRDLNETQSPYLIQMIKNGEYDADMQALGLMDAAGFSVFGAIDAMGFLEFITNNAQAEEVLSSHPYVSLRKHRLSQIIFDQKTNVFTRVKAPRTPMSGEGRLKSRDADFRHLLDKTEEELEAMIRETPVSDADYLDELEKMLLIRRNMNGLAGLTRQEDLQTSFLRHVFTQAALELVASPMSATLDDAVDYADMKAAAAIHDFGRPKSGDKMTAIDGKFKDNTEPRIEKLKESVKPYNWESNENGLRKQALETLSGIAPQIIKIAGKLNHRSFRGFLLPRGDVEDLIQLLKGAPTGVLKSPSELQRAIQDPQKLVSAYLYAKSIGLEPQTEFQVPTTQVKLQLKRKNNSVYMSNPAFRDAKTQEQRADLLDIALLHYATQKTKTGVASKNLEAHFRGMTFHQSPSGEQKKRSSSLREPHASEVFISETTLDYGLEQNKVESFEDLLALPDWAVSKHIQENGYSVTRLIQNALRNGRALEEVFAFMRTRLSYADRRKVFEDLFLGYGSQQAYLMNYLKDVWHQEIGEIAAWFLGMFSKKDALELMLKLCEKALYPRAKDQTEHAPAFRRLAIGLFEYVYGQTSPTFHPDSDSAPMYLDLVESEEFSDGEVRSRQEERESAYRALSVLSSSIEFDLRLSESDYATDDGTSDYKTEKTRLAPPSAKTLKANGYHTTPSEFSLHHYGWNDRKPKKPSIFVSCLTELSLDQLKDLLRRRMKFLETRINLEYRGEKFSLAAINDSFSNMVMLIMLKKIADPGWSERGDRNARLDDIIKLTVTYSRTDDGRIRVGRASQEYDIDQEEINGIAFDTIRTHLIGTAVPSQTFDRVWEKYVEANHLEGEFRSIIHLILNPNVGHEYAYDPLSILKKHNYGRKVPYRQVAGKLLRDSSVYSRLFNAYCRLTGKGHIHGQLKPIGDRLEWVAAVLPNKSIIRDGILDLWETDAFPELVSDLPNLIRLARKASSEGENLRDMWTLLGEMDDDVGRLQRLDGEIHLSPQRIRELLAFYDLITPLVFSPQKRARYGATSYVLWKLLPENANAGLEEHLHALTLYMPEPGILRDDLLMKLANRHIRRLQDAPQICELLYVNNLLSRNRDLRSEDFVSETLLHLFGGGKIEDRKETLLWAVGARDKPTFVMDIEEKYRIDFSTLPDDLKLLPLSVREKFIEAFMLGDNGVLDPKSESERAVMADFLEQVFSFIFPEGSSGIGTEERELISKIFLTVMKSYPPYRRVQVIKALATLRVKPNFGQTSTGERLTVLLGALGPVGIKVAQYLSENEVLVPDERMRSSLGALRNRAPEITKVSASSVLENEVPSSELLVREVLDPVGIASIKQVNRGKWLDAKALAKLVVSKAGSPASDRIKAWVDTNRGSGKTIGDFAEFIIQLARQYGVDPDLAVIPVVFKIRRPNIETTLGIDFEALDAVARELEGTTYKGEPLKIDDLVQTVKDWILLEMNFANEVRFHKNLSDLDHGWAAQLEQEAGVSVDHPRILYATKALIVEEEIKGVSILSLAPGQEPVTLEDVLDAGYPANDAQTVLERLSAEEPRRAHIFLKLKKAGFKESALGSATDKMLTFDYEKVSVLLRELLLHQIFVDGVFHADLHQGNVMLTPEGRLVMIDRGNVGTLNPDQIEGAKILMRGLALRQAETILEGIRLIFNKAAGMDGKPAQESGITLRDIEEILSKKYDLKMTMNSISAKAVQGSKNTPAGKDFSTFMKAFTQAMYLFPTDLSRGMATLESIGASISMTQEEIVQAAQEQAKYFVADAGKSKALKKYTGSAGIMEIFGRIYQSDVSGSPFRRLWRRWMFRFAVTPLRNLETQIPQIQGNLLALVRSRGPRVLEEHMEALVARRNWEIADAVKDILSVPIAEKVAAEYVTAGIQKRAWSRWLARPLTAAFRESLKLFRPLTEMYVETAKEWIGTVGREQLAAVAPNLTVHEGLGLISQIFIEDFGDRKTEFDQKAKLIPALLPPAPPAAEGARLATAALEFVPAAKKSGSWALPVIPESSSRSYLDAMGVDEGFGDWAPSAEGAVISKLEQGVIAACLRRGDGDYAVRLMSVGGSILVEIRRGVSENPHSIGLKGADGLPHSIQVESVEADERFARPDPIPAPMNLDVLISGSRLSAEEVAQDLIGFFRRTASNSTLNYEFTLALTPRMEALKNQIPNFGARLSSVVAGLSRSRISIQFAEPASTLEQMASTAVQESQAGTVRKTISFMNRQDVNDAEASGIVNELTEKGLMASEDEVDLIIAILGMIQLQVSDKNARTELIDMLYGAIPDSAKDEIRTFQGKINVIRQHLAKQFGELNLGEAVLSILETETKA